MSVKENGILQPVAMEMDREELNMLLGSLDAANKVKITLHAEKKGCLNYQTQLFQDVHLIKNITSHLKIFVMDLKTSRYKYVHLAGMFNKYCVHISLQGSKNPMHMYIGMKNVHIWEFIMFLLV